MRLKRTDGTSDLVYTGRNEGFVRIEDSVTPASTIEMVQMSDSEPFRFDEVFAWDQALINVDEAQFLEPWAS